MDSNNLLTDFLDNYFNDPLSDDNNLKPRGAEVRSSLAKPQFHPNGPNLDPETSMSTPNHQTSEKVSPCFEINYGPIMSQADNYSSSIPSLNPYFERSDPNSVGLDDIFKSPSSPSSSTISIRSPIPPPTPSPERLQCLPDIDINNNSNETISADEEDNFTPELIIEESRQSQPSPLIVSASPVVTFTIPDSVLRNDDVLEHHFDVQLSPAMAAQCTETSTHLLSSEEQAGACHQEPVEIYTMQGSTILRSTENVNSLTHQTNTFEEASSVTRQEKSLEINPKHIPEKILPSPEAIKSAGVVTSPRVTEDRNIIVEMQEMSVPNVSQNVPAPIFKTDLTKFSTRCHNQVSVIVTATQSGQNVIPLAQDSSQRDRLWHVDEDDPFRDVPVVRASPPKKRRGRPRGSKNKRSARDEPFTPGSTVCARCVELLQQIRLNPQVVAIVCEECGRTLSPGESVLATPAPVTYKDVASATKKFQAFTKGEVKGNRIPTPRVEIALEGPKMVCWRCHSDDSHGPWHRNKRDKDKFLCNRCLIAMHQAREEAIRGPLGRDRAGPSHTLV